MILGVYGVCTLTPAELCDVLDRLGITFAYVTDNKMNKVMKTTEKIIPVVFSSAKEILVNQSRIQFPALALVVDNPIVLARELRLSLLDAEVLKHSIQVTSLEVSRLREAALKALDNQKSIIVEKQEFDPIEVFLKKYRSSDLALLQTALYRVKDKELRGHLSTTIKHWLSTNKSVAFLELQLVKLHCPPSISKHLLALMSTRNVETLRTALALARNSPGRVESIATKYKINAFDIRYLLTK